MAKRFKFSHPDQLKEIAAFSKDGKDEQIRRTAIVWSATQRQKGKTPWDGRIGVSFYTEGRERKACVFRFSTNDQMYVLGWLKYNTALEWCRENLVEAEM